MKKVGILFVVLSMMSFSANTQTAKTKPGKKVATKAQAQTLVGRFNQLEAEYARLVDMENQEFGKIKANAENAAKQLEEKQALKSQIEEKISKIESAENSKVFKAKYAGIVKEYKNVVKALDSEIKKLSNVVENYQALEQLKGEE
ncbi:MAG: adhesion protein FadA [Leptotrichia sp.]|jgi:adhesion protein fadA|uniref:Adhesion protein FadA n=1 Tax=Leptotrichia rugosa TaxID=3239302 RepID=A0AB39VIB0_9FUSO|nr:adhesion protein FadA [Leptotrichia sp. oral taxon 498]ASQ47892.1 adhesion protein FadA [Leptotrichia sp. oral taxon 498]RKW35125.1 MAG: adhesion protein FadA [Leptotrichia sp.]